MKETQGGWTRRLQCFQNTVIVPVTIIQKESQSLREAEWVGRQHRGARPQPGGTSHLYTRLVQPVASQKVDGGFFSWGSHRVTHPQSLSSVSRAQARELRHPDTVPPRASVLGGLFTSAGRAEPSEVCTVAAPASSVSRLVPLVKLG